MREYYIKEFRPLIQAVIDKCEEKFEEKTTYLAAGALGLSFAFISDVVDLENSCRLWLLILGWILLVACIAINYLSLLSSKRFARKTLKDIDNESQKPPNDFNPEDIDSKIKRRNIITEIINYLTTVLLILGIVFILSFASINLF